MHPKGLAHAGGGPFRAWTVQLYNANSAESSVLAFASKAAPMTYPDADEAAAGKLVARWQLHIKAQRNKTVKRKT